MLAKLLKRKDSRQSLDLQNMEKDKGQDHQNQSQSKVQYKYQRPDLLGKLNERELSEYFSHYQRPVVVPKANILPAAFEASLGYAEVINAGKSRYNEDQASIILSQLRPKSSDISINYLYIGLFDGHGGPGCAVKASKELHQIVHESLEDALEKIMFAFKKEQEDMKPPKPRRNRQYFGSTTKIDDDIVVEEDFNNVKNGNNSNGVNADNKNNDNTEDKSDDKEMVMTVDELVSGALESAFWAMDKLILRDKEAGFRISGGSCALVTLFLLDRVYVSNAGDCRACIYEPSKSFLIPMSYDFTPESDRQRIQLIAFQRPELLRHPITKEKLYNRHVLSRKVKMEEVGHGTIMYRDFYMAGWSCRNITFDDVRLVPLINGRGKQCRLMSTVGVARGLGDHDLVVRSSCVNCKEFLTCQPEVRVLYLEELVDENSALVMASDGLWDVLNNEDVYEFIKKAVKMELNEDDDDTTSSSSRRKINFHQNLAKNLVLEARGELCQDYWAKSNGDLASGDDITCITIGIKEVFSLLNSSDQLVCDM